jgi:arachidonate 15-lipoxygenase
MPLAAYASPAALPDPASDIQAALLPILPPADQVRDQIEVMRFLSGFRCDRLGTYPRNHFQDPLALAAVANFQNALHAAERRIQDRNTRRVEPYEYLVPSNILNSASI